MKVKVSYPVVRYTEIEIPDAVAEEYKDAHAKDDDNRIDFACECINEYVQDTIMQTDIDAECLDWFDWEIID